MTGGPVVSSTDTEVVKTIVSLSPSLDSKILVRSARDLRPRDFVDGNAILIGSPVSNPWVSRFYKFLNFQEVDELGKTYRKYFVNKNPLPGESESYTGLSRSGENGLAYATLALVPNERQNGNVMILQGLQKEGTAAAAIFLADSQNRAALSRALVEAGANAKAWFEILIQAESIAATPGKIQIVAVRIIHPK